MFFFHFKISELCNSEVLFLLNTALTPYRPSKSFFWIKVSSKTKRFSGCFSGIWTLILLILLILILLILKLKKVLGWFGYNYNKVDFICKFPIRVFTWCSFQVWALFLLLLCIKEVLGNFG